MNVSKITNFNKANKRDGNRKKNIIFLSNFVKPILSAMYLKTK